MKALNILIVEDDATIGMLLGEVLVEMGHVICAIEATEAGALAAAAKYRPDMMIVDALLGDESGVAAVEAIQRTAPAPHVFVSGNISKVLALRPQAVTLQKPYTESQLVSAMERAIGAHLAV